MYRALALIALVAAAGCIEAPQKIDSASVDPATAADIPPVSTGHMTATETRDEGDELCLDRGISLPEPQIQCAYRIITVQGEMDLDLLPIVLSGRSDYTITPGSEGTWSLVTSISASGATTESARAKLDDVTLVWSIDDLLGYRLVGEVMRASDSVDGLRVDTKLTLPKSVVYGLSVSTTSGDIDIDGIELRGGNVESTSGDVTIENVEADVLGVDTTSGDVVLKGVKANTVRVDGTSSDIELDIEVANAFIDSTSGDVTGGVTPTATGTIRINTSSGDVDLQVPEDSAHGYDIKVDVSSGDIEFKLKDGRTGGKEDHQTFQTSGFATRSLRTVMAIETSSGDVTIGPLNAATRPPIIG